ncbi:hypothetical protein ACSSS7_005892 [Eimeria intestinalis]
MPSGDPGIICDLRVFTLRAFGKGSFVLSRFGAVGGAEYILKGGLTAMESRLPMLQRGTATAELEGVVLEIRRLRAMQRAQQQLQQEQQGASARGISNSIRVPRVEKTSAAVQQFSTSREMRRGQEGQRGVFYEGGASSLAPLSLSNTAAAAAAAAAAC